jgi:glucose-6-phosphate isomerase
MEYIKVSIEGFAGIEAGLLQEVVQGVMPEIERMIAAQKQGYETPYASINLPADDALRRRVHEVIDQQVGRKPAMLVVIGIGGSCLGTMAVHEMLYGRRYNEFNPAMRVYYVDTVDTDALYDVLELMRNELKQGREVVVNAISKSGTTTETIVNFELFYDLLKKYRPSDYQASMVITTDEGSKLWQFGIQEGITCLAIPQLVGGRYSVFSAVGLFPLGLIGVDIDALCAGAQNSIERCTSVKMQENYAVQRAAVLYAHYQNGKMIHDSFMFAVDAESLGKWYRQLTGESIGKANDREGKKVRIGITPTVSIGTTDLHSVGQLYLGGPRDKVTTFIAIEHHQHVVTVPDYASFDKLVAKIQGKSVVSILNAILYGVHAAYMRAGLPFTTITMPEKSAVYIGQLMQMQMLEIMYLGYMFNVDPFDQPQVELYKTETRKILAHE